MKKLFKCTNPVHEYVIGRLYIHWQWAVDIWAKDIDSTRETYYIKVCKCEMGENTAINIVLWKMNLYISILDK